MFSMENPLENGGGDEGGKIMEKLQAPPPFSQQEFWEAFPTIREDFFGILRIFWGDLLGNFLGICGIFLRDFLGSSGSEPIPGFPPSFFKDFPPNLTFPNP